MVSQNVSTKIRLQKLNWAGRPRHMDDTGIIKRVLKGKICARRRDESQWVGAVDTDGEMLYK